MVPMPLIVAFRIFIVFELVYLTAIGTWKLVSMKRLNRTVAIHTEAMAVHSKRLAAMLALLASPEPPAAPRLASLTSRPVKTANVIAMVAREAADELADD
jgi:hypothetical protein